MARPIRVCAQGTSRGLLQPSTDPGRPSQPPTLLRLSPLFHQTPQTEISRQTLSENAWDSGGETIRALTPGTTHQYVEANLAMKEQALARLQEPPTVIPRYRPSDELRQFLEDL